MYPAAIQKLKHCLKNKVSTTQSDCYRASFDALKISFLPQAVIHAKVPEDIAIVLNLANQFKIPVTTRGAGSSLTGSATPIHGGWVLDMSALKKITILEKQKLAIVQPGVITEALKKAAEKRGLFYPPDPASAHFCTIGGNIACNAGGLNCVKYGVTRDYIIALKGYLPTGEPVSWGLPLRKFSAGYNMRDLWIGSEGTLGVITEATLKLIPLPQSRMTYLAVFQNDHQALVAARKFNHFNIIPCALEFLDETSTRCVAPKYLPKKFAGSSFILIDLDGEKDAVKKDFSHIKTWLKKETPDYLIAQNSTQRNRLWKMRRECSPSMFFYGDSRLNEDIVVPLDKIPSLINFVKKLSKDYDLTIPIFGHLGDGNLHANIMFNRKTPSQVKAAQSVLHHLMHKVIELGGAISGEHGIGLAKSTFFPLQHSAHEINAMLKIKQALDPNNILNPGKIFKPFSPWQYPSVPDKMPWDKI